MNSGLVSLRSPHPAEITLARLTAAVEARRLIVFSIIDHAAAAVRAGLTMPFASLLIFGNPKGGTPLMRLAPTLAIDLPLKALVWADEAGAAWLTYNAPAWMARRHDLERTDLPAAREQIAVMATLLAEVAREVLDAGAAP